MELNKRQLRNTCLLLLCALIWGTAFAAQSVGSGYVGPYTFLASRSMLACVFLTVIMVVRRKMQKREGSRRSFWLHPRVLVIGGVMCGGMLFAASAAQQTGIGDTTTAKAGFLTALYVVLVPVVGVFTGRRAGVKLWLCVAASVGGLYLLCLAGHDTLALGRAEWLLLLCALLFTFQILLVGHYGPQLDGVQLSFAQFAVVTVLSTVFMFVFERPDFNALCGAALSIAYCGIFSSGVAYTLQIIGQKELDPTIASLAMCMESVFSAVAGWLLLGETLTRTEMLGCCLMFAAIVGAQLPERRAKAAEAQSGEVEG